MTLRDFWVRLTLRGVHFTNRHAQLNQLYRAKDPWNLDTPREKYRFTETNRLIQSAFGRPNKLLEIGCGEGIQSRYLREICNELYGIDVAARAVERAKESLPDCKFEAATLETSTLARKEAPFDLVIAAEVLYYISDVRASLELMESLGAACFVTYYEKMATKLDPIILERKNVRTAKFAREGTSWTACWWNTD
ncbi:hypothetical protein F183_A54590 (plasmid) [Bryobacterales bacterium F-183]|nr:hypothetical protein F183_A54590 [Bryobacterales bacterium F-183]